MHKKNAEGLSISIIVIAIIGLIIVVVILALFSERAKFFTKVKEGIATCENRCKDIGSLGYITDTQQQCEGFTNHRILPGTYSDVDDGVVCCCVWSDIP